VLGRADGDEQAVHDGPLARRGVAVTKAARFTALQ